MNRPSLKNNKKMLGGGNEMSYDIYGNDLRRGHCEVHPWVHEEYPCSVCCSENDERQRQQSQEEEMRRELENDYHEEMCGEAFIHKYGFPMC